MCIYTPIIYLNIFSQLFILQKANKVQESQKINIIQVISIRFLNRCFFFNLHFITGISDVPETESQKTNEATWSNLEITVIFIPTTHIMPETDPLLSEWCKKQSSKQSFKYFLEKVDGLFQFQWVPMLLGCLLHVQYK